MKFETNPRVISDYLAGHFSKPLTARYTFDRYARVSCNSDVGTTTTFDARRLPFAWSRVEGFFDVTSMGLISLEGSPEYVEDYVDCGSNWLPNLIGAPQYVGTNFMCIGNPLQSLEGLPKTIGGDFHVRYDPNLGLLRLLLVNKLNDVLVRGGPQGVTIRISSIMTPYLGKGRDGMIPCAAELHKAGFGGMAKL